MTNDENANWHNQHRAKKDGTSDSDVNPFVAFLMPILAGFIVVIILIITVVTMHK